MSADSSFESISSSPLVTRADQPVMPRGDQPLAFEDLEVRFHLVPECLILVGVAVEHLHGRIGHPAPSLRRGGRERSTPSSNC